VESREIAAPYKSGLQTALDVIIAPKAAFAALRAVPTWGWAFAITAVLAVVAAYFNGPAIGHALSIELPAKMAKTLADQPAEKRDAIIKQTMAFTQMSTKFSFIFVLVVLPIVACVQALIMLIANAIAKGDGNFKKFFALSMNVAVVGTGLYSIVLMIIVMIRGADSFSSQAEVLGVVPSLALIAPGVTGALAGFLGTINVFYIWTTILFTMGLSAVARFPRGLAIGTSVFMLLFAACFAAWGAK